MNLHITSEFMSCWDVEGPERERNWGDRETYLGWKRCDIELRKTEQVRRSRAGKKQTEKEAELFIDWETHFKPVCKEVLISEELDVCTAPPCEERAKSFN